ncbi:GIY-YIG nuclease family protein [Devosia aurantiaca]|uniref:GIY-YIG nuclease family protein n=1 Tax=Devosia aurantiaca TaxID=2714858 RepID=A0A6M1S9N5_9HYPH|nr:hypothetical protein [Devosia aurantiaca]NGP16517.1 hypothetical protein [Devosia aurantiaca]
MTALGTTVTIHYRDAALDALRTAESRISPLRVYAGPWSDLQRLFDAGLPPAHGIYLLTGPASGRLGVRPGEASDLRRRLLEHASDPTKAHYAEVYALSAVDSRLTKSACRYLEARVHEIIGALPGRTLEVDRMPVVGDCPPFERDELEALLAQARMLLHAAGCRALDASFLPFETAVTAAIADEGVVEVRDEISGQIEDEHELSYDGVWARGYPTDGGFVVRAGSDVRMREGAALLAGVSGRRRLLADRGVLGELPGVTDRWRLLANVFCSSSLLAAKIVTGAHLSRAPWQRINPRARLVVAR